MVRHAIEEGRKFTLVRLTVDVPVSKDELPRNEFHHEGYQSKTLEAKATCSRQDQFCKAVGRYIAMRKLATKLREADDWFHQRDVRTVLSYIVPELFPERSPNRPSVVNKRRLSAAQLLTLAKKVLKHEKE